MVPTPPITACPSIDPTTSPPESVTKFLAQYRLIECSFCQEILGFLDRQTGYIKCAPKQTHSGKCYADVSQDQARLLNCDRVDESKATMKDTVNTGEKEDAKLTVDAVDGCVSEASEAPRNAGKKHDALDAVDGFVYDVPRNAGEIKNEKPILDMVNCRASDVPKKIVASPAAAATDSDKEKKENKLVAASPIDNTIPKVKNNISSNSFASVPRTVMTNGKSATASLGPEKRERSAAQVTKTLGQPLGVNPFMTRPKPVKSWKQMKYSTKLVSGADVKATFIYALNKYQVQACDDEAAAFAVQEKIQAYIAANPTKTYAKLNRKPVVDEIVLGCYDGEDYYRARVIDVADKDCTVVFIDFGDTAVNTYEKLYELSDELMKAPIYSLTLGLSGVSREIPKVEIPEDLSNSLYDKVKLLVFDTLDTSEAVQVDGVLQDNSEKTINERVLLILCQDKD